MDSNTAPPSYSNPDPRAVAIVGMAIQAPGGASGTVDTTGLFELLKARGSGIVTIPADRWNAQAYAGEAPGKVITDKGAFLHDVGSGDPQEFGISTREASQMSPHQMHILHVTFEALQRSGINYRGTNTGVFIGCSNSDLGLDRDEAEIQEYYCLGSTTSIVANRISYIFDLTGPSLPVDTACSSSLTAMHLAIQAIRNGDCDQAVVGGVSFVLSLLDAVSFSRLGVLSPDGISKSFDADANGYARGEVAGVVIIKRHDLAVRDGDHIHGTLVGTALTTCGSAMGSITTPNPAAQTEAIRRAYVDAKLAPCDADFVELHGTGTQVGDRIEANAAGAIFSRGRSGLPLPIGSIKSNIGHGEMGAYMSSLIKVTMMLEKKVILPNGYFRKPSPEIEFEKYGLYVPVAVQDFAPKDRKNGLIASISSYGFGGSCGHTVLREHDTRPDRSGEVADTGFQLFAIGALSPRACNSLIDTYVSSYTHVSGPLLSEHVGTRARQMPWRTFAVAPNISQASFPKPTLSPKVAPVVFCFSGQGPQHVAMGKGLFYQYAAFRKSILASDAAYTEYVGTSFLEETGLFVVDQETSPTMSDQHIWPASIISVSITMFQIALYDLLFALGVRPTAIVGHSIGETAAFYASGSMSREMVIQIAIARGRALSLVDGQGSMLAVSGCTEDELNSTIRSITGGCEPTLHIASFNSSRDFGISGEMEDIDSLVTILQQHYPAAKSVKLRVSTAVHSPFVDLCETSYRRDLEQIFASFPNSHLPVTPIVSSVTAQSVVDPYDVNYMWANLRQPVRFSTAFSTIKRVVKDDPVVIEFSPHPVLAQYLYTLGAVEVISPSRRPPRNLGLSVPYTVQIPTFLEALGSMLMSGINSLDFRRLNGWPHGDIDPPSYPFQSKAHKVFPQVPSYFKRLQPPSKPLNSERLRVSPSLPESWMADHVINHSNIIPASAYLEMALEFTDVTSLWDFEFVKAFALDSDGTIGTLQVKKIGDQVEITSPARLAAPRVHNASISHVESTSSEVHARGRLGYGKPRLDARCLARVDMGEIASRSPFYFDGNDANAELSTWAQFGPTFRRILRGCANEREVLCWIRGPEDISSTEYIFHPALMDAVFQSFVAWPLQWSHVNTSVNNTTFGLPHSLERCFRNASSSDPLLLPSEFPVYSRLCHWTPQSRTMDCFVLDLDGTVLFTFLGLQFREPGRPSPTLMRYTEYWQHRAFPSDKPQFPPQDAHSGSSVSGMVAVSRALDHLASTYTRRTLRELSQLPEDLPYDRKKYLEWAIRASSDPEADQSVPIPEALQSIGNTLREITERVANAQSDIVVSSTAAVQALFVDNLMGQMYEMETFNGEVFAQTTEAVVQAISQAFLRGRKVVRILEIGAGTGRMTALLGKAFLSHEFPPDCFIEYICTDVSISLAQEATKKTPWPMTTAKAFDVTRPARDQDILEASFDIVVAFDVLHAIPDLSGLLVALRRLLVPNGFLAAIELDGESFTLSLPGTKWFDYIFGSFREWFGALRYRDDGTHCTLSQDAWNKHLHLAGLSPTSWTRDSQPTVRHIAFLAQNVAMVDSYSSDTTKLELTTPFSTLIHHWVPGGETCLVEFLAKQDSTRSVALWVHTEETTPSRALIGIGRSLQQEFPLWRVHVVLFDQSWCFDAQDRFIRKHLASLSWADPEILVDKNGGMRVSRLIPWPDPPKCRSLTKHEVPSLETSGAIVHPAFVPPLGSHDVEVLVDHMSLASFFEPFTEFTGTVVGLGHAIGSTSSVKRIGQRVFGMVENSRAQRIVCPSHLVVPLPSHITDARSLSSIVGIATLTRIVEQFFTSTTTVPKILIHLGRATDLAITVYRILSHKAVQLTVTIDNPQSEPFQHEVAVFATELVEEWTSYVKSWAPSGVDTVVDFRADYDSLTTVHSLLSPTGAIVRFCQGDSVTASPPLRFAQRSINMDLHALINADPIFLQKAFTNADEHLIFCPNTVRAHRSGDPTVSGDSTNTDSSSSSKGDIPCFEHSAALAQAVANGVEQVSNDSISFDPRRTYVVIGGIGGVGIAFARCLIERGARKIVLTSRSGSKGLSSPHLARERLILHYLQNIPRVSIQLAAADCTSEGDMRQVFSTLDCAGVFFMPVLLADALALNMTEQSDWQKVYDVKVKGLTTLLSVVDTRQLDFLLVASSMASVLGSPGQANYTAAQTWMEVVAQKVPNCVAIAVPPILDGGVFVKGLANREKRNAALEKYLNFGMRGADFCYYCLDAIAMILSDTAPSLYIPAIAWEHGLHLIPSYAQSRIRHLVQVNLNTEKDETSGGPSIRDVCASVLALHADAIEEDVPLTSYGLDSLTSVRLSNLLKGNFGFVVSQMQLLASTMTFSRLNQIYNDSHLAELDSTKASGTEIKGVDCRLTPRENAVDGLLYFEDYENLKHQLKASYPPISPSYSKRPLTIFLTGATGFIGSFLLKDLLAQSRVKKVICLVRCDSASDPLIRLRDAVSSHADGHWSCVETSRVQALRGDLSDNHFGLTEAQWGHIAMEVDCIIHNGALVHWVHSYETLRPANVLSVLTAIDLASIGRAKSLIYVSSVATLGNDLSRDIEHPHTSLNDSLGIRETSDLEESRTSLTFGYAQSKWVSEKLVHDAAHRGLNGFIVKPSFVLGDSTSGVCSPNDFFWRLVKGCIQLGYIPNFNTTLNAIAVDQLAKLVSHAALGSSHSPAGLRTLHIDHKERFSLPQVYNALKLRGYSIQVCEYSLWLELLERAVSTGEDTALLPVLEFAHNLLFTLTIPRLDITHTTQLLASPVDPSVAMHITEVTFSSYLSWLISKGELPLPVRCSSHVDHHLI